MCSNHKRDLTVINVGTFARFSEELKTESLTNSGRLEEVGNVPRVRQYSRMETQSTLAQTKRFKGKNTSETSHKLGDRTRQSQHTVVRNNELLSHSKEETQKEVIEHMVDKSTFNGNHFNKEEETVGKKTAQKPNSQTLVNGANYKSELKDGERGSEAKAMRTKPFSKTESVNNWKDQRTKIPVFQDSKPLADNQENVSLNAKRTSSPSSSETGSLITTTKASRKTGAKLHDEYSTYKLSSSHSIQKKCSSKSVMKHSSETRGFTAGQGQVLAVSAGESNAESVVKPGTARISQVLAASAARKLRQRKESQTETESVDSCSRLENNHGTLVDHKNGALVMKNNVSHSTQTSSESKTSNMRNKRKLSQVTKQFMMNTIMTLNRCCLVRVMSFYFKKC
jgi:hypothetical protein